MIKKKTISVPLDEIDFSRDDVPKQCRERALAQVGNPEHNRALVIGRYNDVIHVRTSWIEEDK